MLISVIWLQIALSFPYYQIKIDQKFYLDYNERYSFKRGEPIWMICSIIYLKTAINSPELLLKTARTAENCFLIIQRETEKWFSIPSFPDLPLHSYTQIRSSGLNQNPIRNFILFFSITVSSEDVNCFLMTIPMSISRKKNTV